MRECWDDSDDGEDDDDFDDFDDFVNDDEDDEDDDLAVAFTIDDDSERFGTLELVEDTCLLDSIAVPGERFTRTEFSGGLRAHINAILRPGDAVDALIRRALGKAELRWFVSDEGADAFDGCAREELPDAFCAEAAAFWVAELRTGVDGERLRALVRTECPSLIAADRNRWSRYLLPWKASEDDWCALLGPLAFFGKLTLGRLLDGMGFQYVDIATAGHPEEIAAHATTAHSPSHMLGEASPNALHCADAMLTREVVLPQYAGAPLAAVAACGAGLMTYVPPAERVRPMRGMYQDSHKGFPAPQFREAETPRVELDADDVDFSAPAGVLFLHGLRVVLRDGTARAVDHSLYVRGIGWSERAFTLSLQRRIDAACGPDAARRVRLIVPMDRSTALEVLAHGDGTRATALLNGILCVAYDGLPRHYASLRAAVVVRRGHQYGFPARMATIPREAVAKQLSVILAMPKAPHRGWRD